MTTAARFRSVALTDEVLAGHKLAGFVAQAADSGDIGAIDRRVVFELSQKDVAWRHFSKS